MDTNKENIEFFDIEIVGSNNPQVLIQFLNHGTGKLEPYWLGRMTEDEAIALSEKFDSRPVWFCRN